MTSLTKHSRHPTLKKVTLAKSSKSLERWCQKRPKNSFFFNSKAHVQIMTFVCWLRWQDKTFCRYFLSHSFVFFFQCCPFLLVGHFVREKLTCQKKPKFFACFIHIVVVCVTFLASNSLSTTSLEHAYLAIAKSIIE